MEKREINRTESRDKIEKVARDKVCRQTGTESRIRDRQKETKKTKENVPERVKQEKDRRGRRCILGAQ